MKLSIPLRQKLDRVPSRILSLSRNMIIPSQAFNSLSFKCKRPVSLPSIKPPSTSKKYSYKPPVNSLSIQHKPYKIFGAILRCRSHPTTRYAMVQGRLTQKWSFPKGHSKDAESPLECTQRELLEETGINTEYLPEPTCIVDLPFGQYFLYDLDKEIELIPGDTKEIMDTRWVSMEEMKNLKLNADANQYINSLSRL